MTTRQPINFDGTKALANIEHYQEQPGNNKQRKYSDIYMKYISSILPIDKELEASLIVWYL